MRKFIILNELKMKKKMFISIVIAMFVTITFAFAITDFSVSGWTTNTGATTADGIAYGTRQTPYGWGTYCVGIGTCFTINGHDLWINDFMGNPGDNDPFFDIRRK